MSSTAVEYHSPMLVLDPAICKRIIADRHARTADRHDEVWEGVYVLYPPTTNEHQRILTELSQVFDDVVGPTGGKVLFEINVTDRPGNWQYNFRCPDVAVLLPECRASDIKFAFCGGPDLLVEVTLPHDKTQDKLDFYGRIGVREVLLVDAASKVLELFALRGDQLLTIGSSRRESPAAVCSQLLPLSFQFRDGALPQIFVQRTDGIQNEWVI